MQIETVPLSTLNADPANARKHGEKNLKAIESSLKKFGQVEPLVVQQKTGLVIGGNGRLEVMRRLDFKDAKVVKLDVDNTTAAALAVALNRTSELAEWDEEILGKILHGLREDGFELGELGFELDDLQDIGIKPQDWDEEKEDEVPEVEAKDVWVKTGDLFTLGSHRLLCGDSTTKEDVKRLMAGEKADMVFTDPPYGVSYEKKTREIFNQTKIPRQIMNDDIPVSELKPIIEAAFKNIESVLAKKSSYYVCSPQGGELGLMMMMMQDAGLPCRHMIVWVKNAPVFSMGRLDYDYQHEPILYGWSKNRTHYFAGKGEFTKSVWSVSREPNKLHPTMKPISLIENAVMNSSDPGMLVIDFFLGSGSTLIACEKNNRRCFGMEIDPQYCQVILERWKGVTGKEWEKIG